MFKKIFKPIQIGGATALIGVTSVISYALGLLRDRTIAVNFGTSNETDIYNASFLIPDMLFNLFIAGALTAAFLPIFTEYLIKDKKIANTIANTMLTGAAILITALSLLAFIFMNKIIPFIFTTATPEMHSDIANMTRLMLPSAVIFAISNTLGNILMSYKHFFAYAISPILYNLGIIIGVSLLSEKLDIYSAAIGVLIGATLHCAIRIFDTYKTEFKYRPQLKASHPAFKKIIKLMIPKSISLISWQINLYIYAIVGIKMAEGALASFNFARNIQSFAVSIFGISFATAIFPHLAEAAGENDKKNYTKHIQKTIQRILFFTIPAMAGLMVLSKEIVEIILSGGMFDEKSVDMTSIILLFFAISIPFESLSHIFARAFYAIKNTITPMFINISAMVIIASSTIFLAPKYGIQWFSLGFSIGFIVYIILMTLLLKKHLEAFNYKNFALSISKTIIATGLMIIIILALKPIESEIHEKLSHLFRIIIGASTFFVSAYLLKSEEIGSISYIIERITRKPKNGEIK